MENACQESTGREADCRSLTPVLPAAGMAEISSAALFNGKPQLVIRHNAEVYYLKQTRLGKLILTK